jgi:hypothetical protein
VNTRTYLFPTNDGGYAVMATLPPTALDRLGRWYGAFNRCSEMDQQILSMSFGDLPEACFTVISPKDDIDVEEDTHDLFEDVFGDAAVYLLGKPLDPAVYEIIDSDVIDIEINSDGLRIRLNVEKFRDDLEVPLVYWNMLGVEGDGKRCRYKDCEEAHPVAEANELVTCHACRREMFSTEEGEESQ